MIIGRNYCKKIITVPLKIYAKIYAEKKLAVEPDRSYRSENSRINIPRRRRFPMNRIVPGITTTQASGEWKASRQSHERIEARAACLHVIRSHHVRVHCGLPRRFLSRIMVGLNYYVAPSFGETTVKVSCNPDCNLRTCSSLCVR